MGPWAFSLTLFKEILQHQTLSIIWNHLICHVSRRGKDMGIQNINLNTHTSGTILTFIHFNPQKCRAIIFTYHNEICRAHEQTILT